MRVDVERRRHETVDFDTRDDDGWYKAECSCGWALGPVPDTEIAADALMEHAFRMGLAQAGAERERLDAALMQDVRKLVDAVLTWQSGQVIENRAHNVRVLLEAIDAEGASE